jgi:two-component system sensor histidine kinase and response regulator WspE
MVLHLHKLRRTAPHLSEFRMTPTKPSLDPPKRILVIDDSPTVLLVARRELESAGYEVLTLDNAATFMRSLTREMLDLVLVDVSMPVIGGEALVDIATRNSLRRCPIVLFSGKPKDELEALAKTCGADGALSKGLHGPELFAAIEQFLTLPPAARPEASAA